MKDISHSLLKRQIKRNFQSPSPTPEEVNRFAKTIDETYAQFDEDRVLFERSLEISSMELFQANSYLQGIIQSSIDGIFVFDQEFRITVWNPAIELMTNTKRINILGKFLYEILPYFEEIAGRNYFTEPQEVYDHPIKTACYHCPEARQDYYLESHRSFLKNQSGQVLGGLSVLRNVTQRALADAEQKHTLSLLNATLESTTDGILVVDKEGKKVFRFNEQFMKLWDVCDEQAGKTRQSGDADSIMLHLSARVKDPADFFKKMTDLSHRPESESFDTLELMDGRVFERYSKPQKVENQILGRVWSFRDVTKRHKDEERLSYLANFDVLTNLPNRALFYDRLGQSISRAAWRKRSVALLFLDLDRFKNVNDTFGHPFGDILLKAVADRLQGFIRDGDTVARLGGDEFVILLDDMASSDDTLYIAKKILAGLSRPFTLEDRELYITASIGIAIYPDDGKSQDMLVRNADTAMYRAKEQGKNNFQIYSPALNAKVSERMQLENSLRRAMEKEEFLLYYQPKLDLISGKIIGAEALIRWNNQDQKKIVSPGDFIPLAEEIGLIIPMGNWVLREACFQNRQWQSKGLSPIGISVNISGVQFRESRLFDMIANNLKESGLPPEYLELEITESALMKSADTAESTLNRLDELGIGISLDDFGTGYSSLGYLKRFPVSHLKIDRTFVRDISRNRADKELVRGIITLAHSMDLKVVAEGVETQDQLRYLQSVGCDQIQGYVYSHPLTKDDMTRFLQVLGA